MNKRIKAKKNKLRHLKVLKQLKPLFKAENIKFGNGYFIFSFGVNTVSHFRLKGIQDWQFGMWHHDNGGVSFFGEHHMLIDKFKPSRTYLSEVIHGDEDIQKVLQLLTAIKSDSLLHFACSAQFAEFGVLGKNDIDPHELYEQYLKDLQEEK